LLKRYEKKGPEKGYVLFETGYGPVGPAAYRHLWRGGAHHDDPPRVRGDQRHSDAADLFFRRCGRDAQGARERAAAGDAAPAHAKAADLGARSFGEYDSFGHHNNAMLRRFLDTFGFEYEFISATEFYKSGRFDDTLRLATERYDAIMEIMLASLREERQQTYSCFLPIHPETGRVLYVPMKNVAA
jgi:lysyl-tRNA synthetase class 1